MCFRNVVLEVGLEVVWWRRCSSPPAGPGASPSPVTTLCLQVVVLVQGLVKEGRAEGGQAREGGQGGVRREGGSREE